MIVLLEEVLLLILVFEVSLSTDSTHDLYIIHNPLWIKIFTTKTTDPYEHVLTYYFIVS